MPPGSTGAGFSDVLVLAPDNVWAVGAVTGSDGEEEPWSHAWLARWNGRGWTSTVDPDKRDEESGYLRIEADGRGGTWITRQDGIEVLRHGRADVSRAELHTPCGDDLMSASLTSMARRPGSTDVWGLGELTLCAATGGALGQITTGVWRFA
jgi:hypothetical protein